MGLQISTHAYTNMRERGILPGHADEVVADPDWQGTRIDGSKVYSRNGLAVVVKGGTIVTSYFLEGRGGNGAH